MKRSFLLIVSLILSGALFAKSVTVDQAKVAATAFLQQTTANTLKSAVPIHLTLVGGSFANTSLKSSTLKSARAESPEIYVFTINQSGGFIMVSGDDAAVPVLGYSLTQRLDTTRTLPVNLRSWLEGYRQQIRSLRAGQAQPTEYIKNLWKGTSGTLKITPSAVLPLVKTKWDQSPYYNDLCPYDTTYHENAVVGCVATSMAQILNYWEYPSKGFGIHAYTRKPYGVLSADFGATSYNWALMPDSVGAPNEAVATLMYHCGVAVDMVYNAGEGGGSGAQTVVPQGYNTSPSAEAALVAYFGYSPSQRGLYRQSYSDSNWEALLKAEFDAGRPVLYSGRGPNYGHAFVCDGYDVNNYFHMNWGWSGIADGYYLLDALSPVPTYNFNDVQRIILGIQPKNPAREPLLELTAEVATNKSTIDYGEGFTVTGTIVNSGTGTFTGEYCAAIYDEQKLLIELINIKTGQNQSAGSQNATVLSFTSTGVASMIPGSYRVYILYRKTGGHWSALPPQAGSLAKGYTEIAVTHSNDISLYSPMRLASNPAYANDTVSVWLNVENKAATDFRGSLSVSLYTTKGAFVATIEEKNNIFLPAHSHFADSLNFYSAHVPLDPGSYLLKLNHRRSLGVYELTGCSATAINPLKIPLLEPIPVSDIYEVNDSLEIAFPLTVSYVSNQARVTTPKSNIHSATDVDFYVLTLEPEYIYTLTAALQDRNISTDGKTYSLDGTFSYSTDGENWSKIFDDDPTGELTFTGGTPLYFKVAPWEAGDVGSYLLDIQIERKITTSVEVLDPTLVSLYPNPFTEYVTVSCPEMMQECQVFDMQGRLQKKVSLSATQAVIDLSGCTQGMYVLKLITKNKVYTQKLIKR